MGMGDYTVRQWEKMQIQRYPVLVKRVLEEMREEKPSFANIPDSMLIDLYEQEIGKRIDRLANKVMIEVFNRKTGKNRWAR